jgi:hypothetical protein
MRCQRSGCPPYLHFELLGRTQINVEFFLHSSESHLSPTLTHFLP